MFATHILHCMAKYLLTLSAEKNALLPCFSTILCTIEQFNASCTHCAGMEKLFRLTKNECLN